MITLLLLVNILWNVGRYNMVAALRRLDLIIRLLIFRQEYILLVETHSNSLSLFILCILVECG